MFAENVCMTLEKGLALPLISPRMANEFMWFLLRFLLALSVLSVWMWVWVTSIFVFDSIRQMQKVNLVFCGFVFFFSFPVSAFGSPVLRFSGFAPISMLLKHGKILTQPLTKAFSANTADSGTWHMENGRWHMATVGDAIVEKAAKGRPSLWQSCRFWRRFVRPHRAALRCTFPFALLPALLLLWPPPRFRLHSCPPNCPSNAFHFTDL